MNIEAAVIAYLSEELPGIHVSADLPNPRPDKAITLERTGGSLDGHVLDHPTIAVQCWASSRLEAALLADQVDETMRNWNDPSVPSIERSGKYNFPDEYGNPRYQIVFDLLFYV